MGIMDSIRFWFGILPKDAADRFALVEERCVKAVKESGIPHPEQFEHNMCAMVAWWAIPFHVYLLEEFSKTEITPRLIHIISKLISARVQRDLLLDPQNKKHSYGKVARAMDLLIFDMCRLWQAVFRDNFIENPDAGYQETVDHLKKTFTDPKLALADRLWLYFETEEEKEQDREYYEECGEEPPIDDLEDFADCVTRLYFFCIDRPLGSH